MKITKAERYMLLLTAGVIIFFLGFFLRGTMVQDTVIIETERAPVETALPAAPSAEAASAAPAALEPEENLDSGTVTDTERAQPAAGADGLIDLNTATLEELESLPGIGPVLSQRIVDYRAENGGFRDVSDLLNVEGIGEKTLSKLLDRLKVGNEQ